MRFPYLRKAAPEVLATARAQRWDPADIVRILLEEEIRGRDDAGRRNRRKAAGLPAGKTFASWREADSSIPAPAQHALMTLEWVTRAENLAIAGPPPPAGRARPPVAGLTWDDTCLLYRRPGCSGQASRCYRHSLRFKEVKIV